MAMNKTPFSKRCEILGELWLSYRDEAMSNEEWSKYFNVYDIGLPLSYMVWQDIVSINPSEEGEQFINAAWDTFCAMINIDADALYAHLGECFDASPNAPLEN